jgi:hypothetical protein
MLGFSPVRVPIEQNGPSEVDSTPRDANQRLRGRRDVLKCSDCRKAKLKV